jgi:outer membrane protein assembly factor BamB
VRRAAGILVVVAVFGSALPILGYLKLGSSAGTRTVNLKWNDFPIRYFVTNRGVPGVTPQQFQAAVVRAFNTWNAVDTAETSSQFAGLTQAPPFDDDDMTVLGFLDRPELDRVLGATTFLIDVRTGEIVESDIFFNTTFPWSTSSAGQTGSFDLESIALHEIGHLHGLGHSALGETEMRTGGRRVLGAEAVMFPIAFSAGNIAERTLRADDIAGISDIYPTGVFRRDTGSISGRVTKNGTGVLGAHVVAFNPRTGKLVGGFTLNADGSFAIAGLEPGPHVLRAEPLDDGDIESFFDATTGVDLNFGAKFHDKLAIVPRGGGTRDIEIKVSPK